MLIINGGSSSLDHRGVALKRAAALGVISTPPTVFEDAFTEKPGNAASRWKTVIVGTGTVSVLPGSSAVGGGVVRLDSGASANGLMNATIGLGATDVPSITLDPGVAGTFFYLLWAFRVPTAVDAQTFALLGLGKAPSGGTNGLYFGVDGKFVSTTKFCLEDNSASTQSSVSIDSGWHYAELWQTGVARVVNFGFDGEAPKSLTMTANIGGATNIYLEAGNNTTAASRQLDTDHLVIVMPGNAVLPTT